MMQWFTLIAACRELGGRAARTPLTCPWMLNRASKQRLASRQWTYHHTYCSCPYAGNRTAFASLRRCIMFSGEKSRQYSAGDDKGHTSGSHSGITVVGIPDPILWIRNQFVLFLIQLYFGISPVEFEKGSKQALVYISHRLSLGKFEELRDVVSDEAIEDARVKYNSLTETERRNLAIAFDDIIFLIPEDVSLFFDSKGRKSCFIVMRFWHMSHAEVPEDPESIRIFKVTETDGEGPPRRIVTAVYQFHRELSNGAPSDWTVTSIWHWKQLE